MKSARVIPLRDEALLGWFYCEGQSVFERSTFGALMERQKRFAFQTKPCGRCHGMGFTNEDLARSKHRLISGTKPCGECDGCHSGRLSCEKIEPKCERCKGEGWEDDGRVPAPRPLRRHCKPCSGSGRDGAGLRCDICDGSGMRDGYDAQADGDEGDEPSHTPDDWALQRYAVASRRLSKMRPELGEVLRAFYGLEGLRCGAGHPGRGAEQKTPGRMFAVYQLTRAGKKWIAKLENNQGLTRCGLLLTEWHLQETKAEKWRHEQLTACREQAEQLYARACVEWNAAGSSSGGWRDEFDRVLERVQKRRRAARDRTAA
jgi:hypothetical protein